MVDKLVQQKLYPYDGSEDNTRNPILISPNDIVESNNIIYTTYSTKKKRPGLSLAVNSFPTAGRHILAAVDYWKLGQQRIVYWDGQFIKAVNPQTGDVSNITGDSVLPIDQTVTFLKFFGILIIFFGGGQTPIKYWNMTGQIQNLIDATFTQPFGSVFFNRLCIPDMTILGRVMLSKTNDPQDFSGGDATVVDCMVNDGDPDGFTAFFPEFNGSLYVSKRLSIFQITPIIFSGSITFKPSKLTDGVGCNSHNGVIAAENDLFFTSDRGVHSLVSTQKFAQYETNYMSLKIQNSWAESVNFKRTQYIQGAYDIATGSLLWVYPSSSYTFPTECRGYSLIADKWFRWSDYNQTCLAKYVNSSTRKLQILAGGADGRLGKIDSEVKADYDKKIAVSIQSGIICPNGSPNDEFEFCHISPIFIPQINGTFRIVMKIDGRVINDKTFDMVDDSIADALAVDFITGQSYLGGLPAIKVDTKRIEGHGMMYQLFIEHEQGAGEEPCDFELLGIIVDVELTNRKTGTRVA